MQDRDLRGQYGNLVPFGDIIINQSQRRMTGLPSRPSNNNPLITACEGITEKYWPEVEVMPERSEGIAKTLGQYFSVMPEQAVIKGFITRTNF